MQAKTEPAATRPAVLLAMLLVVYSFNFLDRQILGILAQPVKADLGFTDTQMGALGGLAFAIFYSTLAIPLGLLADRTSRSGVIAASLAVWSGFTALCGMAGNFTQMFLFRLGVGVGEAGGVAPSYALIADRFPPHQRGRAIAVYSLGIPLGSAAGALFGAAIAEAVNWRTAFIVLGVAGLLFTLPFRLLVKEPVRSSTLATPPAMEVFRDLASKPVFWLMSFGAAMGSICGYGLAFWIPALLQRSQHLSMMQTGQFLGVQVLTAGTIGILAGGWLADRLGKKDSANHVRLPAMSYLLGIPCLAAGFMADSPVAAFFWLLLPSALTYFWVSPVVTAVQHLVAPNARATASACFLLINNGIGLGFGALIIGKLSDHLTPTLGDAALRTAMVWSLGCYVLAAGLMLLAGKRLRAAWRD